MADFWHATTKPKSTHSPVARVPLAATAPPISLNELAPFHSITSSVSSGNDSGIESPNALAALRLTRSGKLVDWMTGKSAGFPPRRMAPCAQGPLGAADPALAFPASSALNAVSAR